MADVIVTLKIMPESPDSDLGAIEDQSKKDILAFAGQTEIRSSQEPVAFGLKAVNLTFAMDEDKGSTEELEKKLSSIAQVNSVEVTNVTRAMG